MISVILPTNRVDDHFDLAARSILSSEGVDLELIVVLDAIDPDLGAMEWRTDPRVRFVRTTSPSGSGGTMAYGLEIARGGLIARMDGDDVSHPHRLARQSRYLDDHPQTVAVSCRTRRIDASGAHTGDIDLPAGDDIRRHLLLQNVVPHPTFMTRREVLERVGGYRSDVEQMEDYLLMLELGLRGPIAQLADRLLDYRVHPAQMSHRATARGRYIGEVIRARRRLARHLGEKWIVGEAKNLTWVLVQHLRSLGILRARHRW